MGDEVVKLRKIWIAVALNWLLPGAGYIYVGGNRFWKVALIVVFSALTVAMAAVSPGWLFLNFWARVFFAGHGGYRASAHNRSVLDPDRYTQGRAQRDSVAYRTGQYRIWR